MSDFRARTDAFLTEFFPLFPTAATGIGEHAYDDRWPDMSAAGRDGRLAFADRWLAEFRGFENLSADDAVDRDLLVQQLEAMRFSDLDLREEAWNPLDWVYLLGGGLFPLIAREFAPLAERLGSMAGRLEGIEAVVDAAVEEIGPVGDRPVARFHTEKALEQLPGVMELADEAIATAEAAEAEDAAVAAVLPRLRAAAERAREASARFERHLRDEVLPRSEGEGRLGARLFAEKMRHTMRSDELTPQRILDQAERDYVAVRAEMVRLAGELWPAWFPDEAPPDDEQRLVRGVLDAIAADHPRSEELLDFCREEMERIEAFCREKDLIGLADEPLDIRWTPTFLRAFGGAMLDSPGPLDAAEKAFFAITPVPDDWPEERKESYLREDNARMLRLLTIHEAVPGHYLQGVYANRAPSMVRTIFGSGLFAEGWAVYVTQVMMDVGYGAEDPSLLLVHWKFYLRSITNAIIDARIHVHGMTGDEAVQLMVEGGFQEEAEARNKFDRARLSSTQLSTYFTGSMEFWDIEHEVRRRAAAASGAGDSSVPAPRVVGGFGETPGFSYRPHLENLISHGAPPTSLLRRLVLKQVWTMDEFRAAEAHFRLDPNSATKQGLIDSAVELLAHGYDTPSLWILAGEDNADEREVQSYLDRSLQELGLPPLSEEQCVLTEANRDAKAFLDGTLPASETAERLWTLYARNVAGTDEDAYPSEFINLAMDALMVTEHLPHPDLNPDLASTASAFVAWHATSLSRGDAGPQSPPSSHS